MVSHSADYVVEILEHVINKNHDPDEHILTKLILAITEIRSCRLEQMTAFENFMEDTNDLELPQTVLDMFSNGPLHQES